MSMTVDFSSKRPLAVRPPEDSRRRLLLVLTVALCSAFASGAGAQGRPSSAPSRWDDTTGESNVYPIGDAVDVYRSVLDLLYIDGRERPPYIILVDTAQRFAWTPCTDPKCANRWIPKSEIDSATLRAYSRQSPKRPRMVKFKYSIPIHLVSTGEFERMMNDGYAILAGMPPDKVGGPMVFGRLLKSFRKPGDTGVQQSRGQSATPQAMMSVTRLWRRLFQQRVDIPEALWERVASDGEDSRRGTDVPNVGQSQVSRSGRRASGPVTARRNGLAGYQTQADVGRCRTSVHHGSRQALLPLR